MSVDVQTPPPAPAPSEMSLTLRRGRLTRVRALLYASGGVAIAAALFVVTPLQGRVDFLLVAYVLAAIGYLAGAYRVEGRRAVVDRLASLLVGTAVIVCLIALGSILIYTVARGINALSPDFFTHSMNGVGPRDANGGAYHAILGT
ncbi:MAG TPA: hypothetical protein VF711_04390, partial [Acidimicrobiales bacterium]